MSLKYNQIGKGYNQTRKADPYIANRMAQLLEPNRIGTYLDIGCGTGNYTDFIQKIGIKLIGIDPSIEMLRKAETKNRHVHWKLGTAEKTGLKDATVDGIMGTLTMHHWTNHKNAFIELNRVLKPGGKIVFFTSTPKQMKGYWLNHYFPNMMQESIEQMPSNELIFDLMNQHNFTITYTENYNVQLDLEDQFLYCGKEQPELYFDPTIRNGISSFTALANLHEVESGLKALRQDIARRKITEVVQSYRNINGDYLFIVGKRKH